jgi:CBS domain containing-hemolysin-like protein
MDPDQSFLIIELVSFCFFLLLSAFFSSSETALTSITKLHVKRLSEKENRVSPLDVWVRDPNRILATLLVGNNVANVGASVLAAFFTEDLFIIAGLERWSGLAGLAAFVGTTTALLIFGEIIPKIYAKHHSERLATRVIQPLNMLYSFPFKPVIAMSLSVSNTVIRLFGGETSKKGPFLTEDDIKILIEVSEKEGVLEEDEREMIHSIIELGDTIVKEVMVPRTDIVRLDVDASIQESLNTVVAAGHSRIPVYDDRIDNIVGILYAKDLLAYWQRIQKDARQGEKESVLLEQMNGNFTLRSFLRPPTFVPETKKASEMLKEFQQHRTHMAIVVDEYGGTAGLVTIEDVLEEIVGEIQDEYDTEGAMYTKVDEDVFEVDARISLTDLADELKIVFPEDEDFETLSGFISSIAGRVPRVGEKIDFEGNRITILDGDERHVQRVRIKVPVEEEQPEPVETARMPADENQV